MPKITHLVRDEPTSYTISKVYVFFSTLWKSLKYFLYFTSFCFLLFSFTKLSGILFFVHFLRVNIKQWNWLLNKYVQACTSTWVPSLLEHSSWEAVLSIALPMSTCLSPNLLNALNAATHSLRKYLIFKTAKSIWRTI